MLVCLLVVAAALAVVVVADRMLHRGASPMTPRTVPTGPGGRRTLGSWLSLPAAPRPTTADDAWVLEAFDVDEISELRRIDAAVRREQAAATLAVVQARVPGDRRLRRVRAVAWHAGRLTLVLADGTSLELDGVRQDAAVWLAYCQDQFGLVLEDIGPAETTWAARLASCGVDTPLQASRLRVS